MIYYYRENGVCDLLFKYVDKLGAVVQTRPLPLKKKIKN